MKVSDGTKHLARNGEKLDHCYIVGENIKWYSHSGNSSVVSAKTTSKHTNTIKCSDCTLGHLSQRMNTYVQMKTGTQIFIATLFKIATTVNSPEVLQQLSD